MMASCIDSFHAGYVKALKDISDPRYEIINELFFGKNVTSEKILKIQQVLER